jgi:hypothetical protein
MLKAIRRSFASRLAGKPWYPALAEEVVDEELAGDGEARKGKVLASLVIPAPEQVKVTEAPDGKKILLEAVRLLGRPDEDLAAAAAVLEENERLFGSPRKSRRGWLRRLFGLAEAPRPDDQVYKVQYNDPGVPTPKTESINFPQFIAEVQKKSSLLTALSSDKGPAFRRLVATPEKQLAAFVDKQLNELVLIHRRLDCLNTVQQARVIQRKKTARGIKIELLTIKNAIIKANQRRHEYKEKDAG